MQSMRRFFVPRLSTMSAFDYTNRQSIPREGVAAPFYTEGVSFPALGHTIQIVRVGADRRVRPHRETKRIQSIESCRCLSHFRWLLVGAGLCACPFGVSVIFTTGRRGRPPLHRFGNWFVKNAILMLNVIRIFRVLTDRHIHNIPETIHLIR